ncbi:hypothetical protein LTR20_008904 [Exophiala xenobiotica]|nr:hypothetical protein LTS13_008795 [Exophiala xenobiotica]KAK5392652.1 hypothetical protein LTR79_010118 [Exophiala xenobiotica]KAK5457553.1 hypothetical protein LTR20_008904 [Exophiala xenobiotica]KAK5504794.1 hypothetical protein LTR21_009962 [Exophiala xenobiotica]
MNNAGQPAGQQEDYLDKGLDAAEKRFGQGKVDPTKQRSTNEKVTDKARDLFEKATGKNIPDKYDVATARRSNMCTVKHSINTF